MPLENFGVVRRINQVIVCRSAQPDDDGFQSLRDVGIESIFKLNGDNEYVDKDEELKATPILVYLYHLPELLRFDCTQKVIQIAQLMQAELLKGRSVLVHCSHGRDRTGLVIAAWGLMYDGQTFDQVNKHRWDYGMSLIIDAIDYPDKLILHEIDRLKKDGKI